MISGDLLDIGSDSALENCVLMSDGSGGTD